MPSFVDIATLTKLLSLTGNEEFQVSPTQKVTAKQIADLAPKGVDSVVVTNFNTKTWTGGKTPLEMKVGEIQAFTAASGTIGAPSSSAYAGFVQKTGGSGNTYVLKWLAWSSDVSVKGIYVGFSMNIGNTAWNKVSYDSESGVASPIQITDFAKVTASDNWPTPKDGLIIPFVTDSGVLNKPGNESEYVGIIICEVDTQNTGRAEVIAYGSGTGACYVGLLDYASVSIEWRVNKLSVASRKLSAFTESAIFEYIYQGDDGDVFPFTTINATKSTANQFPANGLFTGIISKGSNEGDYFNILAFRNGSNEVYVGSCIGNTTQWTPVGGSGGGVTPILIMANEDVATQNKYPFKQLGETFPLFIDMGATNNPSLEGYPCIGIAQCIWWTGPASWEAVLTVSAADADQTPRGDFYKAHLLCDDSGVAISDWIKLGGGSSSGGITPGTVIFNDEFSFDGYTSANPGQLSLLQPIPLGSIVTFIGSYYFGPPAEEILLSPESPTWSLTVALPTGVSSIAHYLKDMLVVQNPSDANLVVDRQHTIYKIDSKNLVNNKISTIDMYATGALLSDMYLTIDQIIYVAQV